MKGLVSVFCKFSGLLRALLRMKAVICFNHNVLCYVPISATKSCFRASCLNDLGDELITCFVILYNVTSLIFYF